MTRTYYSVIPARVMNDKNLSGNEKLLYAEITALANEKGYCYMGNKGLAEKMGTSIRTIQRWLQKMAEKEYIVVKVIRGEDSEVVDRRIYINDTPAKDDNEAETLTTDLTPPHDNNDMTSRQNCHVSITDEYYIKKENTSYSRKKAGFTPPTKEEIEEYCQERKNKVDAQKVYDFYSANDWKDSNGKPIKNWKQKIIGVWERNQPTEKNKVPDFTWDDSGFAKVSANLEDLPF